MAEPAEDLSELDSGPLEIPTYYAESDQNRLRNGPCLSHLSFKLLHRSEVHLVAIYRYHYYGERAPGNLLGLSQLLAFVSKEAGLQPGTLTCVSTYAYLDSEALVGSSAVEQLVS